MLRSFTRCAAFVVPLGLTLPGVARAQGADAGEQPYQMTLSVNPIALPFGLFSAEFERAMASGFTFGAGGSYFDGEVLDDDEFEGGDGRDAWVQAKLKYYPGETALKGFAVGLTLGYQSAEDVVESYAPSGVVTSATVSEGAATVGVVLDYNWLIGRRRRFLVGTGIGARRVLKDVNYESPLAQVYPDGRLQIGFAF